MKCCVLHILFVLERQTSRMSNFKALQFYDYGSDLMPAEVRGKQ